MLNLLPLAQVPRKAGAKLQHFHETNKSFAKFYIIKMHFSPKSDRLSNLQGGAGGAEPLHLVGREMGREGIEDTLMVLVEPVDFLWQHHLKDDRSLVDGTEGERLELQELAELRFLIGHDEQGVLRTGTTTARQIDARLISDGHTCHQWGGLPLHSELVRSLMDIQIGAHTVTCAMQVVHMAFQDMLPR